MFTVLFGQCKKDDTEGVITIVYAGSEIVVLGVALLTLILTVAEYGAELAAS